MFGKMVFWICIVVLLVCAYQNHVFDGVGKLIGIVKQDIEYQQSFIPENDNKIDDHGGQLTVEEGEKKVTRRGGFGAVHTGYQN